MNLTVLELGLKNRQISTVKCFLRIQHETFRLSLSQQNLDITATERIGKDWDQVFNKLITIINATITDQSSKHFAQSLARIAFKTLSLLIDITCQTTPINDDFSQIRTHFYELFMRNNVLLKNALKIEKIDWKCDRETDSIELNGESKCDDIIKQSILKNCMVLAQYSMKKHQNVNIEWNYIIEKVIQSYISHLNEQNGDQTNSILNNLGLDLSDVLYKIYTYTTDTKFRKMLSINIDSNNISAHNLEKQHFLLIKNLVDNNDNSMSLNLNWIISMQNDLQQRIFLWHLFEHNDENSFTLLDASVACNYLIDKNDFNKLIYWMQNESSDSDVISFPFNWSIDKHMIESIYNRASICAKEILLNKLCEMGTFCETELNDFQLTLYRMGRVDTFDYQLSHSLDNSQFSDVINVCNSDDFTYKLINYCIDFNLYDYLYLHLKNFTDFTLTPFNNFTNLLNSSLKLVCDSNDNILKVILESAQYIYDLQSPVTIKSLIDCGHIYLALIAISYSPFNYCDIYSDDINDLPDKALTFNSVSSNTLKTRYPILHQSFIGSHCEQLTVYMLLKDTVPFDVSKMFCWQLFNNIQNCDDDITSSIVFTDLPHFSHNKLANLYGLKANLNFIYFLSQGRVIEAHNKLMSNKKKLNAKYLEHACKRAALLSYSETTNQQLIVSCIVFQQLLMNDFSQTSLHLAIANIIMDYASEFLGLTVRHQHIELSRLLKRAHYYKDKRASAKLLQLTNAALTRKYKNYNNMQIEECFDWKIPLKFVQFHNCDFPLDFLQKCAKADNWLMFTVYCQLHDCPKDQVMIALKHFSNQCISEHLIKAFQSSHSKYYDNENGHSSRLLSKTEKHQNTSAKYLRNTLYSKLRIHRNSDVDSNKNSVRNSFKTGSSSFENDDQSIASESEFNAVETISAFSSSSNDNNNDNEEMLKFSSENIPKDFFQVILNHCNLDSTGDPIKPLYYLSIPLSNPILCLIGSSFNNQIKKVNEFNIFWCWLLASVDFDIRRQFCEQNTTYDALNSTLDDNYRMLDIIMRNVKSYRIFLRGIKIFNLSLTPITDLLRFMISFFCEKDYFEVQNLKSFQDNLWKYEEPNKIDNYFYSKDWIQRASVIILISGLRIANNYESKVLLRHYDISRVQETFSPLIKVPNFRKMYRVSHILSQTNLKLPIEEFLSIELLLSVNSNCALDQQYCLGVKKIAFKLQQNHYFSEAIQFANVSEIDSKDIVMNEWILKAAVDMNSIEFWYSCWNSLVVADPSLSIAFKMFKKYINQVSSILVKCYLIFKCIEAGFESKIDCSQLQAQLWKCIVDIESDTQTKQENRVQWNELWDQIMIFLKINRNDSSINQISLTKHVNSNSQSLDYVIEKLLSNVCIESAHKVALLFGYSSKDLDITLTCYKVANGDIKHLSEVPVSVKLKSINSIMRDLPEKFNNDQKETIKFLESTCKLVSFGQKACQRILLYYKIACLLDINFSDIDRTRLYDLYLLKCLISFNTFEALNFAKDLIQVNKISEEEVATIICNYVINKLNAKNTKLHTSSSDSSLFSLEDSAESNFISLLRLLNDTTVLGYKLIKEADEYVHNSKFLFTEILIAAHQCFTISCDVKGIALVLTKTRAFITQDLMQEKDFKSIVRLMTGIGRYSEMTYCFDIIREYNQFELILTKRIETVPQLRIALLDFLKGDKDNYPLVALRFCLYRHSAENLESNANELLERLNLNNATNLFGYKPQLDSILRDLIDAENNYKQASCHTRAAMCYRMAQLIALQIHYLSKNTILIKLNNDRVSGFIQNCPKFEESWIIAEVYQHHTSWSIAIINNVIKKNNYNYLSAFNAQIGINNSSLIEEIIQKYKQLINQLNSNESTSIKLKYEKAIRKLIEYIDDIEMKVKVAFKLNLKDLSNSMIDAAYSGSYLRDLRRLGYL